jgi:hypothetical protein
VISWWGPDTFEDNTTKNLSMADVKKFKDFRIALFYESAQCSWRGVASVPQLLSTKGGEKAEAFISHFEYMARTYFDHPNYLKASGAYVATIRKMRANVLDKYGFELYLVGDEVFWTRKYLGVCDTR